jgi:tripartite-type tricarboxylate transporter receptor subunit TctC
VTRGVASAVIAITLICTLPWGAVAVAQSDYPSRPIRLLVGFAGGTAPDIGARVLGDKLAEALGKPVVIENVIGASGNIAGDRVAKSEPDGHTLALAANSAVAINPYLYVNMPYDPLRDLAPISNVFSYPNVLVINPKVPATNVAELVALARAQPGKLTIAHPGISTTIHLSAELFRMIAGIDIQPVPYRGGVNLLADVVAGQVDMTFGTPVSAWPFVREGKLRALAITSRERLRAAPEVPTLAQSGFPDFDIVVWHGLFAPAGTPPAIIEKLSRETNRVLALPQVRQRFDELGCDLVGNTPEEFASVIKAEAPRWAKLVDQLGLKID